MDNPLKSQDKTTSSTEPESENSASKASSVPPVDLEGASSQETDADTGMTVNEQKWSKALMRHGWIAIPSIIVERQHALGLDGTDLALLLHLIRYWWERDRLPHPAISTLAGLMNLDRRTIQRRMKKLNELGLLARVRRQTKLGDNDTNEYDLSGLIHEATVLANAALREKEIAEKERVKKKRRGRVRKVANTTVASGKPEGGE